MAYTDKNYKTKKEFKEAVAAGKEVRLHNPPGMFPTKQNGTEYAEGPHYPQPHRWYAIVEVRDGVVTRVK